MSVLVLAGGGRNQEGQLALVTYSGFLLLFSKRLRVLEFLLEKRIILVLSLLPLVQLLPWGLVGGEWRGEFAELGGRIPNSIHSSPLQCIENWLGFVGLGITALSLFQARVDEQSAVFRIAVVSLVVGLFGLGALWANKNQITYPFQEQSHVFSYFPNRNQMGMLFAVGVVTGIWLVLCQMVRRPLIGLVGAIGAGCSLVGLSLSISKGALLIAVLGGGACLLRCVKGSWSAGKRINKFAIPALAFLLVAGFVLLLNEYGDRLLGRFSGFSNQIMSGDSFRIRIWSDTFELWKNSWLSGIGLDQFRNEFWQYREASVNDKIVTHPENDYLWLFVEFGIIGTLFIAFYCLRGYMFFKESLESSWDSVRWICSVVLCMMLMHGLIDISLHVPATLLLLVVVFGLCLNSELKSSFVGRVFNRMLGGIFLSVAAIWGYGIYSDDFAIHSADILYDSRNKADSENDAEYWKDLDKAIETQPLLWQLYARRGFSYVRSRQFEKGDENYEIAKFLEPITYRPAFQEGIAYFPVSHELAYRAWSEALMRYPDHGDRKRMHSWIARHAIKRDRSFAPYIERLRVLASD